MGVEIPSMKETRDYFRVAEVAVKPVRVLSALSCWGRMPRKIISASFITNHCVSTNRRNR